MGKKRGIRSVVAGMLALTAVLVGVFEFSDAGREYARFRQSVGTVSPRSADVENAVRTGSGNGVSEPAKTAGTTAPDAGESRETMLAGPDPEIKKRLIGIIREAERTIEFSIYVLSDSEVVDALAEASGRGVSVRGIVERNVFRIPNANRVARDRLLSAGADVKAPKDDPFAYFHAKYLVADGARYVVSTGNYAKTSFSKNREFFVFGEDPEMTAFLRGVFEADFSGIPYAARVPERAYLAPYDAREKLSHLLSDAQASIEVLAPSLSDSATMETLSEKSRKWVRVSVCLREKSDVEPVRKRLGPNARVTASSGPPLHAKGMLSDGKTLWVGSVNFTDNSLDRNREVGFVRTGTSDVRTYETTLRTDCKW